LLEVDITVNKTINEPKLNWSSNAAFYSSNMSYNTSNVAHNASNVANRAFSTAFFASQLAIENSNFLYPTNSNLTSLSNHYWGFLKPVKLVADVSDCVDAISSITTSINNTRTLADATSNFTYPKLTDTSNFTYTKLTDTSNYTYPKLTATSNIAYLTNSQHITTSNLVYETIQPKLISTSNQLYNNSNFLYPKLITTSNFAYNAISSLADQWLLSNNMLSTVKNVGIGKSNPEYKLDVFGTIQGTGISMKQTTSALNSFDNSFVMAPVFDGLTSFTMATCNMYPTFLPPGAGWNFGGNNKIHMISDLFLGSNVVYANRAYINELWFEPDLKDNTIFNYYNGHYKNTGIPQISRPNNYQIQVVDGAGKIDWGRIKNVPDFATNTGLAIASAIGIPAAALAGFAGAQVWDLIFGGGTGANGIEYTPVNGAIDGADGRGIATISQQPNSSNVTMTFTDNTSTTISIFVDYPKLANSNILDYKYLARSNVLDYNHLAKSNVLDYNYLAKSNVLDYPYLAKSNVLDYTYATRSNVFDYNYLARSNVLDYTYVARSNVLDYNYFANSNILSYEFLGYSNIDYPKLANSLDTDLLALNLYSSEAFQTAVQNSVKIGFEKGLFSIRQLTQIAAVENAVGNGVDALQEVAGNIADKAIGAAQQLRTGVANVFQGFKAVINPEFVTNTARPSSANIASTSFRP